MKIYLDTCCLNRPFDDQTSLRISLETQAVVYIMDFVKAKRLDLVSSFVLAYKNSNNPNELRRKHIENFLRKYAIEDVGYESKEEIKRIGDPIIMNGIKVRDAYHVASAIFAQCDYFLSTDDKLLKYTSQRIILANPMNFITILESL